MKFFFVAASVALASEDVMLDEGLSLLQMRAQPHKDAQEPKYYLGGSGTSCAPEEDIDYAQCLEAQVKQLIPNVIQAWGLLYNQRSGSVMQRGCFIIGGNIYFSDEPASSTQNWRGGSRKIQPICSKSGGFDTYIANSEISCQEADCQHKAPRLHLLNWGDAVVVPELQILEAGATCEACGILSFAQCTKAADMGLVTTLSGKTIDTEPANECSGGGHSRPASPSGCSIGIQKWVTRVNFCPYDTPDGQMAGLVSDSGVGVGYNKLQPICGVCTTTTTTTEAPEVDPIEEVIQEPVYTVQAGGTMCKEEEVITFAKCLELQNRQIDGIYRNDMGLAYSMANQRGHSVQPAGCFKAGKGIYFNDEPAGGPNRNCLPICSPNGGRAAEIVAQGISCQEPTCKQPAGHHKLIWDDSVVMPELRIGAKGGVCEAACELLTYEQCTKAGDMGLIEALSPGNKVQHEPIHQAFGAVRAFGTMPSGCSANIDPRYKKIGMYWNSMDTPSGIRAAPDSDGQPWVSATGVGVGYHQNAPVCGVCTTTTTTTEAPEVDPIEEVIQAPVPDLGPLNTQCAPEEVLTFEQCTAAKRNTIENGMDDDLLPELHLSGPNGCFFHAASNNGWSKGGKVYWNPLHQGGAGPAVPSPNGTPHPAFQPICSTNGGRQAELKDQVPAHPMKLPPGGVELLAGGAQCEECGVLNLDQCIEATRIVNHAATGQHTCLPVFPIDENDAFTEILGPVGCFRAVGVPLKVMYYNPGSQGGGAAHANAEPVCGVCPSTTEAPPPVIVAPEPEPVETCPCTSGLSLTLKSPQYSNLGGAGPDTTWPEEILYPEAGVIGGRVVNVKVSTSDRYKGKGEQNGIKGSLGRLNMKTGQENTFHVAVVDAETDEPVQLGALPMTFLDLDEGKKGKGRVSVSVCDAEQFTANPSELTVSAPGGCATATSSTKGTSKDNPSSVEGALADDVASKRVVSYIMDATETGIYTFKLTVAKGFGRRNFLFTLTPGAACSDEANMPAGCAAAMESEGF